MSSKPDEGEPFVCDEHGTKFVEKEVTPKRRKPKMTIINTFEGN
jgi:hypothetical protein